MNDELFFRLLDRQQKLVDELRVIRTQIRAFDPHPPTDYRIALRPDDSDADPFGRHTLMDDIVVNSVPMFHAEQMDINSWWVCCYLDEQTGDRITWNVQARTRPTRIEWTVGELPDPYTTVYEHELANPIPPSRKHQAP